MNVEWDAGRRVLVAAVQDHLRREPDHAARPPRAANGRHEWQAGLSGGTILLAGTDNEPPLIFNRIAIGMKFDTDRKRVVLTQADISNGEIGIAGTGSIDYADEARLQLGFAGTPMSASALKRMWPILIVPEVREWVIERIEKGTLQRIEVGVNSPVRNLPRKGPPIPDDGLAVNIVASGVTVRPVNGMPVVRDADLRARVTGPNRTGDRSGRELPTRPPDARSTFPISRSRCRTWRRSRRPLEGEISGSIARCRRRPRSWRSPTASAISPAR